MSDLSFSYLKFEIDAQHFVCRLLGRWMDGIYRACQHATPMLASSSAPVRAAFFHFI